SAKYLLRDRDAKFTADFDEVLRTEGVEVIILPYRAPRANSIAERFVGTVRRELLDHLLIFGHRTWRMSSPSSSITTTVPAPTKASTSADPGHRPTRSSRSIVR